MRPGSPSRTGRSRRTSEDDLSWLGYRVEILGKIVEAICRERIASLELTLGDLA